MANLVFIATSLDGFIADKNNEINWLHETPNPEGNDLGYGDFIKRVDGIVMGRNTFEIVLSFDLETWPYEKPVFVLSNTLTEVPENLQGKVFLVNGPLQDIMKDLKQQGYENFYIDGGKTIQSFLAEDLIDELIITTIPVLLGTGIPLFAELPKRLKFKHQKSVQYLDCLVQNTFVRERG